MKKINEIDIKSIDFNEKEEVGKWLNDYDNCHVR
ncbi:hypothetical protein CcarbDRAFT_4659 [Clostridium carboxidivorans P7]|uniref:Uncharacterized protein n=1 Tax=Clostridium carboxidivorans P7 TaxID=536227 RepID=C6Q0U2_9CLOT|nr:hypothetical protein CcarbDRAFT_4659 [Clostridium carboxidivorans P7]